MKNELSERDEWGDRQDRFSDRIHLTHPIRSQQHDRYMLVMELVGNRRSKGALVDLVNWLLAEAPHVQ